MALRVITPTGRIAGFQQPEVARWARDSAGDDLQHVGVDAGQVAQHLYHHPREHLAISKNLVVRIRRWCLLHDQRDVFQESGGFDEAFTLTRGIDCLKVLRAAGA